MADFLSRRQWMKNSLGWGGAIAGVLGAQAMGRGLSDACLLTPPQTEGPFYPENDQADKDNDLTRVKGKTGKALGQIVYLSGQVQDEQCNPVAKAMVEIWQACAAGRYNHSGDPNTKVELDPNFQYWGRAFTDQEGRYDFKTILPGHYPASPTWERPPHIHYKVHALGYHELTTQLYFLGDKLNDTDLILLNLKPSERERVIIPLELAGPSLEPGAKLGTFDLTVRKVRG